MPIRMGIKKVSIHMRIITQVLHILENRAMAVYNVFFFSSSVANVSILVGKLIKIMKKVKIGSCAWS
jgi:hypothetical protein